LAPGTLGDWIRWGAGALGPEADSPRADAEVLLAAVLGLSRNQLAAHADGPIEQAVALRFAGMIERRRLGEPVAYIAGRQGFWTLDLAVDTAVLIPRPDTETLVEWALHLARYPSSSGPLLLADLGTGSGAIALSLAAELPGTTRIVATDVSAAALAVAAENARGHQLANVEFREGSWLAPLADERYDLIVSNPPYIAEQDPHLADLRYEPRLALTSGRDGMAALCEIAEAAPAHLKPGGWLLMEHGATQGEAVRALLRRSGFINVETRRDFGGNERVSGARVP
jgi:release factor glutamine methyltransferase